ncbi:MAG TPA: PEP-utilizing enzyme, partial [bacterium]|nr:PEP-utilizing enzyme [bacterium]
SVAALSWVRRAWLAPLVRVVLREARTFSLLRENQRFVFDLLMASIGDVCRAAAARLERDGRLTRAADVVFLEREELVALGEGALSAPEAARRIAVRKAERARAEHGWMPTFLFEEEARQAEEISRGAVLHGVGVSPGRITGRVRVARSLDDVAALQAGEILVVKATDPGWTPYFPAAGALVSELGGMLSHAAVVAREYGLPAVANIANATDLLRDGEEITVDGDAGTVARTARP